MTNPWDVPPFPTDGDDIEDSTYAGVGRVMSGWESVELELSYFHSLFVGRHEQLDAMREYGTGDTFQSRKRLLAQSASAFFTRHHNQEIEGDFCRLIIDATKFSHRRNDIAHGIVKPFEWIIPPEYYFFTNNSFVDNCVAAPNKFVLVPQDYTGKKFDANNKPVYTYVSATMISLQNSMYALYTTAHSLRFTVISFFGLV
jgi:hypothetical protein